MLLAPLFATISPQTNELLEGDQLELNCLFTPEYENQIQPIEWSKDDQSIDLNQINGELSENQNRILKLNSLNAAKNNGNYKCTVKATGTQATSNSTAINIGIS